MAEYPVMALRNMVLFPDAAIPIAIGREKSVALLEDLVETEQPLVLVAQRDESISNPTREDLYDVGTLAEILKVMKNSQGYTAIIQGKKRLRLGEFVATEPYFVGDFSEFEGQRSFDDEEQGLVSNLTQLAIEVINATPDLPDESVELVTQKDASSLADFVTTHANLPVAQKQEILAEANVNQRLQACIELLTEQLEISKVSEELQDEIRAQTNQDQREYYLRKQLKAIKDQLGEATDDISELEHKVEEANMPPEAYEAAQKQLSRLQTMQTSSSEYSVTLNYIETLCELPWGTVTEDNLDLTRAKETLDADHYGLDKIKKRIKEYLAVRTLKDDMKGPILCLVGPPGVGKTSLGRSIARTMGRKFTRISLGGVHDESEIRGHRRTYVGAMPGRIARAVSKAGSMNPVVLLDEVDKIGQDFRGDPGAALLEVLDPEQNNTFSDHFLGVPLDLSKVLFIATANQLAPVSPPLRDRMEIIEVPSYTLYEKQQIARNFLIPKQAEEHGLVADNFEISPEALKHLIEKYTREAGVRNLEREIAALMRSIAVKLAEIPEDERDGFEVVVDKDYVQEALGPERHFSEVAKAEDQVGVATGLAWTQAGGDILYIEAQKMSGKGELKLTGQLGDVMKESVHAALSLIRAHADAFGIEPDFNENMDLHLHVPAGAIPKDGPSAGITMFTALLSRLTDVMVRKDVAMTGEITLSGRVLPVGGIKEKVIAAHRAGVSELVLPEICRKDLVEVDEDVLDDLVFHYVERVEELPDLVFVDHPFDVDLLKAPKPTEAEDEDAPVTVN